MSSLTFMQVENMVREIASRAIICKVNSETLTEWFHSLPVFSRYSDGKGRNKHPHYLQVYAKGYFAAMCAKIYQEHLEFCYVDTDGTFYSTHKESIHRKTEEWYQAGKGSELGKLPSGHYWKGTKKPFYTGNTE